MDRRLTAFFAVSLVSISLAASYVISLAVALLALSLHESLTTRSFYSGPIALRPVELPLPRLGWRNAAISEVAGTHSQSLDDVGADMNANNGSNNVPGLGVNAPRCAPGSKHSRKRTWRVAQVTSVQIGEGCAALRNARRLRARITLDVARTQANARNPVFSVSAVVIATREGDLTAADPAATATKAKGVSSLVVAKGRAMATAAVQATRADRRAAAVVVTPLNERAVQTAPPRCEGVRLRVALLGGGARRDGLQVEGARYDVRVWQTWAVARVWRRFGAVRLLVAGAVVWWGFALLAVAWGSAIVGGIWIASKLLEGLRGGRIWQRYL